MPAERCAPPTNTPAGAVCVLRGPVLDRDVLATWDGERLKAAIWSYAFTPEMLGGIGWRFVRVAGEGEGG